MDYSGYMILSDFDGTLSNDGLYLKKAEKEAIHIFVEGGGLFGVATGRSMKEIKQLFEGVELNAPCILYNGALIISLKEGKILRRLPLSVGVWDIVENIRKRFSNIAIQGMGEGKQYLFHSQGDFTALTENFMNFMNVEGEKETATRQILYNLLYSEKVRFDRVKEPIYKIVIMADTDTTRTIREYLGTECRCEGYMITSSAPFNIEITSSEASKGQAGIYIKNTVYSGRQMKWIALGDEKNDIDALQNADYSFAPEDARERVGRYAGALLKPEKGMIKQVLEFLKQERKDEKISGQISI